MIGGPCLRMDYDIGVNKKAIKQALGNLPPLAKGDGAQLTWFYTHYLQPISALGVAQCVKALMLFMLGSALISTRNIWCSCRTFPTLKTLIGIGWSCIYHFSTKFCSTSIAPSRAPKGCESWCLCEGL